MGNLPEIKNLVLSCMVYAEAGQYSLSVDIQYGPGHYMSGTV